MQIWKTDGEKLFFLFSALDFFQKKRLVNNSYLNFYLEKYSRLWLTEAHTTFLVGGGLRGSIRSFCCALIS